MNDENLVGIAFTKGEYGWQKDVLYESKIPSNVYAPDIHPADQKKIK